MGCAFKDGNNYFLHGDSEDGTHKWRDKETFMPGGTFPLGWTRKYGNGKVFVTNLWNLYQKVVRLTYMKKQSSKRLDFIKAAHESEKLEKSARMEDYLEVIGELVDMKGYATTLDISRYMNVSAPSVTKMLKRLDKNGYLYYEKYHGISLTPTGEQLAETIRQKHGTLLDFFEILGIGREIANQDAEGVEHHLNAKTVRQIRKFITFLKSNPKIVKNFNDF